MSWVEILITVGTSVGVSTFLTNKVASHKTNELLQTVSENQEDQDHNKRIANETNHRLFLLEEVANQSTVALVSSESIQVSMRPTTAGISYEFHYLNRPVAFLKLFYDHLNKRVETTYIHAPLLNEPTRTEKVIYQLRRIILMQQNVRLVKDMPALDVSPIVNQKSGLVFPTKDPVLKKAQEIMEYGRRVSELMDINDVESKHFLEEKTVYNVEKLLQAYKPLKEATKKQCQEKMIKALERMKCEIEKRESKVEDKKIKELEHALHSVETVYQEETP